MVVSNKRKIRCFGVSWHVSHNYSLLQIPNTEWSLLKNNVRRWKSDARPLPEGVKYVPYYEPGKYDIAVLHIDQQCIDPMIGKGKLYRDLNKVIQDIPKIVINHGTPWWPEKWEQSGRHAWKMPIEYLKKGNSGWNDKDKNKTMEYQKNFLINGGKVYCDDKMVEIEGMRQLVGKNTMVVNSYEAKRQWGWGKTIWHGLDSNDWWDLPKEPRVVISQSPGGLDYYYNRVLLSNIISELRDTYGINMVYIGNPNSWVINYHQDIGELGGWGAYRDFLGRSLVYINPTKESPMPRARTEAQLSGCCILSTPYHDADKFLTLNLKDVWKKSYGVNDFISKVDPLLDEEGITGIIIPDNPMVIAALTNHLIYNRFKTAVKIGQCGKELAKKIFSHHRFNNEWLKLLYKIIKE